MVVTNPNGANQYQLDPRQKACWEFYTDIKGETFGNATQSAIKAGYTVGTADTITTTEWFIGKLWKLNATYTGERKMKQLMELEIVDPESAKVDVGIARIQADLAKYLTSTQGKNEGYSTRQEVTGKDGKDLPIPILGIDFNKNVPSDNSNKESSPAE
jgi:hypothetical protein